MHIHMLKEINSVHFTKDDDLLVLMYERKDIIHT